MRPVASPQPAFICDTRPSKVNAGLVWGAPHWNAGFGVLRHPSVGRNTGRRRRTRNRIWVQLVEVQPAHSLAPTSALKGPVSP